MVPNPGSRGGNCPVCRPVGWIENDGLFPQEVDLANESSTDALGSTDRFRTSEYFLTAQGVVGTVLSDDRQPGTRDPDADCPAVDAEDLRTGTRRSLRFQL